MIQFLMARASAERSGDRPRAVENLAERKFHLGCAVNTETCYLLSVQKIHRSAMSQSSM